MKGTIEMVLRRAAVLIAITMIAGAASAQTTNCAGSLPHPHPMGLYNFDTNSRLEGVLQSFYKAKVVPCVKNNDPSTPVRIIWLVPRIDGWVQPQSVQDFAPAWLRDEREAIELTGCLSYGNRGDTTLAKFWGDADARKKVDEESKQGCRSSIVKAQLGQEKGWIDTLSSTFKNFFPADKERPEKTMLQIEGKVDIEKRGDFGYAARLIYYASPVKGSEGKTSDLTLIPMFTGAAEALLPRFRDKNPEKIKVVEKDLIIFEVQDVKNPMLTYAAYAVLDKNGEHVGTLPFPVFVNAQR
jgi:hypothetical protein